MRDGRARRHPLSYLLEAADDICYRIIDMEDARELRIIGYQDIKNVMEPLLGDNDMDTARLGAMDSDRRRSGMLRTRAMACIIPSVVQTFMECYEDMMAGTLEGDLLKHAQPDVAKFMSAAKEVFNSKIMNNPQKTAEVFVQNPLNPAYPELIYRTGDLGRYNEYGELVFVARRDSQIKHMGHRIELAEIEAAAAKNTGIARACAVYDAGEKKITLFYTVVKEEISPGELTAFLSGLLPRYMLPGECVKVDEMPYTVNGKLDRAGLLARAKERNSDG